MTTKELKKTHSSRLVGGAEMSSQAERTPSKTVAGGLREEADYGAGRSKRQLAGKAAAGGPSNTPCNPGLQHREVKPQTTD